LTTLFGDTAITTTAPIDARPARKKMGWLPLLTVLFCISYALMTMLIVEQGSTIESQRALIRELFRDSSELSATKMKALRQKNSQAQHSQAQAPSTQVPSTQTPSAQAPSAQIPSTQAQNQAQSQGVPRARQNSAQKTPQYRMPSRPAADLTDARRALITI
jgi:hypothetical protein